MIGGLIVRAWAGSNGGVEGCEADWLWVLSGLIERALVLSGPCVLPALQAPPPPDCPSPAIPFSLGSDISATLASIFNDHSF